jgi:hypothetical protein
VVDAAGDDEDGRSDDELDELDDEAEDDEAPGTLVTVVVPEATVDDVALGLTDADVVVAPPDAGLSAGVTVRLRNVTAWFAPDVDEYTDTCTWPEGEDLGRLVSVTACCQSGRDMPTDQALARRLGVEPLI